MSFDESDSTKLQDLKSRLPDKPPDQFAKDNNPDLLNLLDQDISDLNDAILNLASELQKRQDQLNLQILRAKIVSAKGDAKP